MSENKDNLDNGATYNPNNLHISAMTPSIITTINNTNPTPPSNNTSNNINNNINSAPRSKKPIEPYESYIEDSFVGHWEREDDDIDDIYQSEHKGSHEGCADEDESTLHPSTIEFDFDSFGPESFIYTPSTTANQPKDNLTDVHKSSNDSEKADTDNKTNQDKVNDSPTTSQDEDECKRQNDIDKTKPSNFDFNNHSIEHLVENAQIDLKVIEPYKKVISHAGYCHHFDASASPPKPDEPAPAIIVFSACYLPDRSRRDYNYVMDHLFLYVLASLHELIADDYILIYLHNTQPSTSTGNLLYRLSSSSSNNLTNGPSSSSTSSTANTEDLQHQNNLPTFTWIKRCYQMIDRKLRKNLKILYLVKPTFWLKTIVIMCKPFISTKFSKKLRFVEDMEGLKKCLPIDKLTLPASAENI